MVNMVSNTKLVFCSGTIQSYVGKDGKFRSLSLYRQMDYFQVPEERSLFALAGETHTHTRRTSAEETGVSITEITILWKRLLQDECDSVTQVQQSF